MTRTQTDRTPQEGFFWRERLYARLRGRPHPLFIDGDGGGITPAASLWAGTRLWTEAFRAAGLGAGARVVLALPPSPGFLGALLAGLWDGLTVALLRPGQDLAGAVEWLDASAGVGAVGTEAHWCADASGLPVRTGAALRRPVGPSTPEARLLLATSGTTAAPRWVALSDANVWAVIDSHGPHLGLDEARLLSVLPWHHCFGLVIELLPALLAGAEIIRDASGGRDGDGMAALMAAHGATHLNAVPLTVERLLRARGGEEAAARLRGGVVGGAAVEAPLAAALGATGLRVGYGQTEASPGIALGAPGVWAAGYLGRPLGCSVEVAPGGMLRFAGPNACLGVWRGTGLERLAPDRWVETGDLVRADGPDLYFVARADDEFKLSNGRRVPAGVLESGLKAGAPQLRHALLYSPDGDRLELLVGLAAGAACLPLALARDTLGPLGARLRAVRELPPERWAVTPKGEMDRRQTLAGLESALAAA